MGWTERFKRRGRAAPKSTPRRTKPPRRRDAAPARRPTILPWYLIVLGVAVSAATSAAQKRAVARLTTYDDRTDPLPKGAPDWLRKSRQARSVWTVIKRIVTRIGQDNLMLVAAGIAFYGMFAIFPALGALVSIYGLFGDTHMVQEQVQQLTVLLPSETGKLINDSLNALLDKPNVSYNSGLAVSLGLAIWGARAGTSSLMSGLNVALQKTEQRSFLVFNLVALGLTLGAIVFAIVALIAVAILPIVFAVLPLDETLQYWLAYLRWPVLGLFLLVALDVVYRFGPSHTKRHWHLMTVGTVFALAFWILASWAFSLYVTRFGTYDKTYGSLGAVIVLLLWFWITALIVLIGATIDAVRAEIRR